MAVPTIDSSQGVLGYRAYETFSFMPGGSGSPEILYWQASSLPTGMTIDAPAEKAATGVASTDIITVAGHGYANGDKVYFQSITGGAGLSALTVYFVRDKTTDTLKLAATLTGPAIDFTTDISAAQIRKCGTSQITGSISTPGQYVVGFIAVNATGSSAISYFTIGIDAGDGSATSAGSSDTGIDVNIDVVTREMTTGNAGALFLLKRDDTAILNIRFKKNGVALDPNPTSLRLAFKKDETDAVLFTAGGSEGTGFTRSGSGASAVFRVPVTPTGDLLNAAFSDEEKPTGTQFDALCEAEWKQDLDPAVGGVTELIASTKTATVILARDLVV